MKAFFNGALCLLLWLPVPAQRKVERYCIVSVSARNTRLLTWKRAEYFSFKDTSVIDALYKVEEMRTGSDVLNYMSAIGWNLAGQLIDPPNGAAIYYYFKREFDPSELVTPAN
jgi:hypothetical protein